MSWYAEKQLERAVPGQRTFEDACAAQELRADTERIKALLRRDAALAAIDAERERQLEKWGPQSHSDHKWLAVLAEEFGEVAMAINEHDGYEHLREELVQVAAVAAAWVEDLDDKCGDH